MFGQLRRVEVGYSSNEKVSNLFIKKLIYCEKCNSGGKMSCIGSLTGESVREVGDVPSEV